MGRLVILALAVAVTGATAWTLLKGETWTFRFTQQQIDEQLASRFPIEKDYLWLVGLCLDNARAQLAEGASDIAIGFDARAKLLANGKEWIGSIDLLTEIAYDATRGAFVLHDPRVTAIDIDGVVEGVVERVKEAANQLAASRVSGITVYKLRPADVEQSLALLVLKAVYVEQGVLHVDIGL